MKLTLNTKRYKNVLQLTSRPKKPDNHHRRGELHTQSLGAIIIIELISKSASFFDKTINLAIESHKETILGNLVQKPGVDTFIQLPSNGNGLHLPLPSETAAFGSILYTLIVLNGYFS